MSSFVQRFTFQAHPTENHPKYFSWVIADVCLFVSEDNRDLAIKKAYQILKSENWIPIQKFSCSTLIEERVLEAEKDIIEAYEIAKERGYFLIEFPSNWIGNKDLPPLLFPKVGEKFIDKVIRNAGGNRLSDVEKIPQNELNADYLIDDYIIELKILNEEGITKNTRQDKIADIFFVEGTKNIYIKPNRLSPERRNEFLNIMGTPVKNDIKKASKQIKNTKKLLNNYDLKAALIIMNTNYTSIVSSLFNELIEKYLKNDTNTIKEYIAIDFIVQTNGFDSYLTYQVLPTKCSPTLERIKESFNNSMDEQ